MLEILYYMRKWSITAIFIVVFFFFYTSIVIADSYWLAGGLAGAGVGGAFGSVNGIWCSAVTNSESHVESCVDDYALGIGIGAAAGFGFGALIGNLFKKKDISSYLHPQLLVNPERKQVAMGIAMSFQ